MKNPCDDCLVKINCTQICFAKSNYITLIDRAIVQHRGLTSTSPLAYISIEQRRRFKNYLYLQQVNIQELKTINIRMHDLKNPGF